MWRSLVAHLTGGQGVAGSNPVIPTITLTAYRVDASGYNGDYAASGSVILIKRSAVTLGPFSQVNYSNWLFGHSLQ